jgi:hypothetical protein
VRVANGLGQVDGLGGTSPVPGQFADPIPRAAPAHIFQGLGHHSMRPGSAIVAEAFVESVLDESVGEAVAPCVGHLAH